MCVVIVAKNMRPKEETLEAAAWSNSDGAGVGWFEKNAIGQVGVKWEKGIQDVRDMVKLAELLPLPYVMHFRIATAGGSNQLLTHPFPISKNAGLAYTGIAKRVLFHNGHWSQWEDAMARLSLAKCVTVPGGMWSDTRAMAWISAHIGELALKAVGDKIAVMDAEGEEIRLFGGWEWHKGLQVSNSHSFCGQTTATLYRGYEWERGDEWDSANDTPPQPTKYRDSRGRWVGHDNFRTETEGQTVVAPTVSCPVCATQMSKGAYGGYWCPKAGCEIGWLSEEGWLKEVIQRSGVAKASTPAKQETRLMLPQADGDSGEKEYVDAYGCLYTLQDGARVYTGEVLEVGGEG